MQIYSKEAVLIGTAAWVAARASCGFRRATIELEPPSCQNLISATHGFLHESFYVITVKGTEFVVTDAVRSWVDLLLVSRGQSWGPITGAGRAYFTRGHWRMPVRVDRAPISQLSPSTR